MKKVLNVLVLSILVLAAANIVQAANVDVKLDPGSSFNVQGGNVGIGTTNPKGKLHVATLEGQANLVVNPTTGNVGIGTSSPTHNLVVGSDLEWSLLSAKHWCLVIHRGNLC